MNQVLFKAKDKNKAIDVKGVGIRVASGEYEHMDPWKGRVLEVQSMVLGGKEVLLTMNTYEALLNIVKFDGTNEAILDMLKDILPGAIELKNGIFKYLPRMLPINYGEEITTYRNAMLVLSAAA
jgi:methyl coenzyme M reductase subunit D